MNGKRNQILILPKLFYYYCCTFSCLFVWFFFKSFFSPSKHIKIMFKVFKLILNINIEGKVCSHHTVWFCETEQKPIRYDVNMALVCYSLMIVIFLISQLLGVLLVYLYIIAKKYGLVPLGCKMRDERVSGRIHRV